MNSKYVSNIYVGTDGKLHKVIGGADTVLPFSSGLTYGTFTSSYSSTLEFNLGYKPKYLIIVINNTAPSIAAIYNEGLSNSSYIFLTVASTTNALYSKNRDLNSTGSFFDLSIKDNGFSTKCGNSQYNNKPSYYYASK